jgi:hypothetical protein
MGWAEMAGRGNGMKWRVMVELIGDDGTVCTHEIGSGRSHAAECPAASVGLTLADGKRIPLSLNDRASSCMISRSSQRPCVESQIACVRRTTATVSSNLRQKPTLIARRAVHLCASLHLGMFPPIDAHLGEERRTGSVAALRRRPGRVDAVG